MFKIDKKNVIIITKCRVDMEGESLWQQLSEVQHVTSREKEK